MNFTRERALTLAAATVSFGASALFRKMAVDRISPLKFQVIAACVYTCMLPVYLLLVTRTASNSRWSWEGVIWSIVATIVGSFGGIMFGYALRAGNDAGVVTSLSSLSPIVTLMLSFVLLGERPSFASAVGCALVLAGVVLISYKG